MIRQKQGGRLRIFGRVTYAVSMRERQDVVVAVDIGSVLLGHRVGHLEYPSLGESISFTIKMC